MPELDDCRVLVVEDEFYLADDIRRTLVSAGAAILGPYPRAKEARAALNENRPDMAVLDVNLGSGPDFTLADDLRERAVPFVFFTGYDQEIVPLRFADVIRLQKPVDAALLIRAVQAVCGGGNTASWD